MNQADLEIEKTATTIGDPFQNVKEKLIEGTICAISIDTCIFTGEGYRLDSGILKLLEQFKGNTFQLFFSEMTIREIHNHIARDSDEAKAKLNSALKTAGKFWPEHKEKQEAVFKELFEHEDGNKRATSKLKDFIKRCGVQVIEAKSVIDVSELLSRYFSLRPPFELSKDKKAEFPDAITLLSLEAQAKKIDTGILFVTKDKGCTRFCNESKHLYAIDDLSKALTLIQERDAHCANLCASLEKKIANGDYPDLIANIEDAIASEISDMDWFPEADAPYYYEPEMQEVSLLSINSPRPGELLDLHVVDFRNDLMVVRTTVQVEVEATCIFSFSITDSFDRDEVPIGSAEKTVVCLVDVDILITFKGHQLETPEIVEFELLTDSGTIEFGSVEVDYGDEDPSNEYY